MIPNKPVADSPGSEKTVFAILEKSLPGDWIVIHSRRFVLPAYGNFPKPIQCETDFIVFSPKRGYIGLEVKGGKEIGRDHDGWYSISHQGKTFRIKDPGSQAQNAVHTVNKYLRNFPDFNQWTPPFGWGVCFPGVPGQKHFDSSLPREYVIDKAETSDMLTNIERIFDANGMKEGLIPSIKIQAFLKVLAPTFKLAPSLATRFDDDTPALVRLTEEQNDLLDMFDEFNRVAVKGAAGTGKTLVAMEKARRLAEDGKRVLLLCFNEPLAKHLAKLTDEFTIEHFHGFAAKMCRRSGTAFKVPFDEEAKDKFWAEDAAELLGQFLQSYPDERYDAVIVDEAQDFKPLWWLPVESLLRDPKESVFYIFYDPNQQIYDGGPADDLGLKSTGLKYNCRNTKNIADYSCKLVDLIPILKDGTPDGEQVMVPAVCESDAELLSTVRKTLHDLVNVNQVSTDRIVILTTGAAKASPLYKSKLGDFSLIGINQTPGPKEVCFDSLHRFKGLESDVVILCGVRPGEEESAAKNMYVATSRARHLLVVVRVSN